MARLQCVRPRHRERAVGPRAGREREWISRPPEMEEWPVDLPPPPAMGLDVGTGPASARSASRSSRSASLLPRAGAALPACPSSPPLDFASVVGDKKFCVSDASTVRDANDSIPLSFSVVLLESVRWIERPRRANAASAREEEKE